MVTSPGYRQAIEKQYRRYLHELARPPSTSAAPSGESDAAGSSTSSQNVRPADEGGFPGKGGSFGGGGTDETWDAPAPQPSQSQSGRSAGGSGFNGGGGSFGGGGASGAWEAPAPQPPQSQRSPSSGGNRFNGGGDRTRAASISAVPSGTITAKAAAVGAREASAAEAAKEPTGIVWVDENLGIKGAAKDFNDSAASARSNVVTRRTSART